MISEVTKFFIFHPSYFIFAQHGCSSRHTRIYDENSAMPSISKFFLKKVYAWSRRPACCRTAVSGCPKLAWCAPTAAHRVPTAGYESFPKNFCNRSDSARFNYYSAEDLRCDLLTFVFLCHGLNRPLRWLRLGRGQPR